MAEYRCEQKLMIHEDSILEDNPLWYRDAIIYQVHIKAFADSDADGIGGLSGLIGKVDYLQNWELRLSGCFPFIPLRSGTTAMISPTTITSIPATTHSASSSSFCAPPTAAASG